MSVVEFSASCCSRCELLGALGLRTRRVTELTEGVVWVRSHGLLLVDDGMSHDEALRYAEGAVVLAEPG